MKLSIDLDENIRQSKLIFPLEKSFDLITRNLFLGQTRAYWIGVNGFCKNDVLQQIFSDLQNPLYTKDSYVHNIEDYMNSKIGYAQTELTDDWEKIAKNVLSGPSVLFIDGFAKAIILDTRTYPTRGVEEPDAEKVTQGAKDGFVETLLFNANLIRRRIRTPKLTFSINSIGSDSKTDVAVAYVDGLVDEDLLLQINQKLSSLEVTSLTMGNKSLEELLIKKRWYNPLPSMQITERPDVACSYLMEGHVLILVDNTPAALILPCTIFQFTQSPDDYYKSPSVGTYFRLIRFGCILVSLLLMPLFLLLSSHIPGLPASWHPVTTEEAGPIKLFIYVLFVELGLDLFKYSSSHSSDRFSSSLSIVGGLIISDVAIQLQWANLEVIFYAAATMLATLTLSSIEFGEALRIYRIFLVLCTGFFGLWGVSCGLILVFLSTVTTPTFAGKSYLWPLFPFEWSALRTLLFRYPTAKSQPSKVWIQPGSAKK